MSAACLPVVRAQDQPEASVDRMPMSPYIAKRMAGVQPPPSLMTGIVVTQDLQPVAEGTVRLTCSGVLRGTSRIHSNGQFALTINQSSNSLENVALTGCDVSASTATLRSEPRLIGSLRPSETRDVGQIIVHPTADGETTTVSAVSLLAPADAKKSLRKGREAATAQKWAEAQKHLQRAVQLYPKYAEAWQELGLVLIRQSKREEARAAFQQAVAADPAFSRPYFGLVGLAADAQDWPAMRQRSEIALARFSDPLMYFYHAIASFNLHQYDTAEKSLMRADDLDRQHRLPQIDLLLGDVLIQRHDFAGAAARVRQYLAFSPNGEQADAARAELARLEQLNPH